MKAAHQPDKNGANVKKKKKKMQKGEAETGAQLSAFKRISSPFCFPFSLPVEFVFLSVSLHGVHSPLLLQFDGSVSPEHRKSLCSLGVT